MASKTDNNLLTQDILRLSAKQTVELLYPGIACVVGLCAMDGQTVPVHGTVIWCRYVTGRVHEHGVEFTDPINLPEFVPGAEPA